MKTPEIYLGEEKSTGFGNGAVCTPEGCDRYVDSGNHEKDKVYLSGDWIQEKEFLKHIGKEGYILLNYTASSVNAVLKSISGTPFKVWIQLDGKYLTRENAGKDLKFEEEKTFILVGKSNVYNIIDAKKSESHELKLIADSKDFSIYSFAFG